MQTKLKALVVDDEPEIRDVLAAALEKIGFAVTNAEDGSRATSMAENDHFDVIITDIKMPRTNGVEFVGRAKQSKLNKNTPIYIITGNPDTEILKRVAAFGVANIVVKPFSAVDLAQKVFDRVKPATKPQVSYDVGFINCCLTSVQQIMDFYLSSATTVQKPMIKSDAKSNGFASGIISIGQKQAIVGSLSFTVNKSFIKSFAKSIFGDQDIDLNNEMAGDMTGELCNQLVGKLKLNLAQNDFHITIGLPKVIVGENHILDHHLQGPTLAIPIKNDEGMSLVEICLIQNIEKGGKPADSGPDATSDTGPMFF